MKVLEMPKPERYDFSQLVINLSTGRPYRRAIEVDVTVEDVIIMALMPDNPDMSIPAGERQQRFNLAEKLKAKDLEDGVSLTPEEIALIRKACSTNTPTQFYGWVMRALEPKRGDDYAA